MSRVKWPIVHVSHSLHAVLVAVAAERKCIASAIVREAVHARLTAAGVAVPPHGRKAPTFRPTPNGSRCNVEINPAWMAIIHIKRRPSETVAAWVGDAIVALLGERAGRVYDGTRAAVRPKTKTRSRMVWRWAEFLKQCASGSHGPAGWAA